MLLQYCDTCSGVADCGCDTTLVLGTCQVLLWYMQFCVGVADCGCDKWQESRTAHPTSTSLHHHHQLHFGHDFGEFSAYRLPYVSPFFFYTYVSHPRKLYLCCFQEEKWYRINRKRITECRVISNDEVKRLVNLGLAACNCYPFHLKCDKNHVSYDVTGRWIKSYVKNLILQSKYDITLAVDIGLKDKEEDQVYNWLYGQIINFKNKEEEKKKKVE